MKEKRISFGDYEAGNIYEWYLALNQGLDLIDNPMMCICCPPIAKKLKKFLGKEAKQRESSVKEHPYFKKKK